MLKCGQRVLSGRIKPLKQHTTTFQILLKLEAKQSDRIYICITFYIVATCILQIVVLVLRIEFSPFFRYSILLHTCILSVYLFILSMPRYPF